MSEVKRGTESPSDQVTILVVDDSSSSLVLLVKILTAAGYQIHTADSGEAALAAVAGNLPDLILLDVRMEGVGGLDVCRQFKAREETRFIPIILISAFAGTTEWVEGLRLGAADFITKPFQTEELLMRVRIHLALRRAKESIEQQAAALRETNARLESEVVERRCAEDRLRLSLDRTDRSRRAMLSAMEDQKQAEQARAALETQLRVAQKMEAVGSLAGGVAHDFNNLLSVILNYTDFALLDLSKGDSLRNDLLEVKKAGERAAVLTRQLLAFSRRQVLQPVPLNLNEIAEGVGTMLRRILGEDIELVRKLAPDLGLTLADPGQMEQVLMNLAVNARDAMPKGGKLTIETAEVALDEAQKAHDGVVTPGPYVTIAVSDSGTGMDRQTMERIFDPFFTTKGLGRGTGLGLSTVYGIVKQSGGSILVDSEVGRGTSFKIYLPRAPLSATSRATKPSAVSTMATATETILVVDDEEALCKIARRALEAAGHTVLTAADGDEALLTGARHTGDIHLLLTDVVMPRMGGGTLAQALSQTRPTLKVLYMSGYTDDAILHHGTLDTGTHFLGKPFTAADLKRKVREVLDDGIAEVPDEHEQPTASDAAMEERPLDKEAFRALPQDLLDKLRQAAIAARYDEIVAVIETIREAKPNLAAGLGRMVDQFDYVGLRRLFRESNEAQHDR